MPAIIENQIFIPLRNRKSFLNIFSKQKKYILYYKSLSLPPMVVAISALILWLSGAWSFDDNPIHGIDVNHYRNEENTILLSSFPLSIAGYDEALLYSMGPIGIVYGGLIHTIMNNTKY